jgi:hypothetical protein
VDDAIAELVVNPSGKLGDTVYSHNRHGPYTRPFVPPNQPGSPAQSAAQVAFADCVSLWHSRSAATRLAWLPFSRNVRFIDRLGQPYRIPPFNHYIRGLLPRILWGNTNPDAYPKVFRAPYFSIPTVTAYSTTFPDNITVTIADDPWRHENDALLLVYVGPEQSADTHFFAHPFINVGVILGSSSSPPPLDNYFSSLAPLTSGLNLPVRFRLSTVDNRLSHATRFLAPVV